MEFEIDGALHYGWARAQGEEETTTTLIFDWAYESVPGRGIRAGAIPEPSAAALLLVALASLCGARRRPGRREGAVT